jgi:poly(3-hydroxyalkanoate) synthetase
MTSFNLMGVHSPSSICGSHLAKWYVANLLNLGMDVYLIDWGYPSRGDRFPENFADTVGEFRKRLCGAG